MTDHPGEQFPSEVDPDVEPGFEPEPDENSEPDYDSEPGAQSSYSLKPSQQGVPHTDPLLAGFTMYGEPSPVVEDTEQAFEASLEADVPETEVELIEERHEVAPRVPQERDEDAPHPLVEETMARLDELRERPVAEHAEVYADLHERLQTALVEADAEDRG